MLEVLIPPIDEPVTLAEVKRHCRLYGDLTEDDELLALYIESAREYLEGVTARAFVTQTLRETRTVPESGVLRLLRAPVIEVLSIVVDGDDLTDLPAPGGAHLSLTAGSTAVVTYVAGYTEVPAHVKHAILLMVAQCYERREPIQVGTIVATLPFSLKALISRMSWGGEVAL